MATTQWDDEDDALEARVRAWAIPVALLVAFLLVRTGPGHFLLRVLFSMWIHELGHAATAWLCGYLAFPGPWLTPVASEQSLVFEVLVLGALGYGTLWANNTDRPALSRAFAVTGALQLACAALLGPARARQFIVFMGDGGCLVIGAALMLTVYAPRGSALQRGWLRWGFLAIGAAAFADVFEQWWASRTDPDRIPFGMNEGAGLSDPSVLSEQFGWSATSLVHRYVALGCACLCVLAAAYVWGRLRLASDGQWISNH